MEPWREGVVHGHLVAAGWGAQPGFPGMRPDPAGNPIAVYIFGSEGLPSLWPTLDGFEGDDYARTPILATMADRSPLECSIDALRDA